MVCRAGCRESFYFRSFAKGFSEKNKLVPIQPNPVIELKDNLHETIEMCDWYN